MIKTNKTTTLAAGLAMFSMFFGAGNIVFPLALGQIAQDKNFVAILGMLITAVGVPFLGLLAMTLFNGDYHTFFGRMGKIPGFLIAAFIMGLIGPFGAMPRCIALSYSTAKIFLPEISLYLFSAIACLIIFLFTIKKNSILDSLGYFLTPILLGSLAIIIVLGLLQSPPATAVDHESFAIFFKGLKDGYQTMDLLATFFFSAVVIACLKDSMDPSDTSQRSLMITAIKASIIGALLLAIIYVGFSFVASYNSASLAGVSSDELISQVAIHVLGSHAAIIACLAVALTCLTTAIALAVVFSEFIQNDIFLNKIGYLPCLIGTLLITYFVSTLNFKGIAAFLSPILQIMYPFLIVLSVLNILYKLYNFKPIKTPVIAVFLLSVAVYFLEY